MLSLDEIAPRKGHGHYHLVITAPELGLVLDVLHDRKRDTLGAWFSARGAEWCAAVEQCSADMWDAYHVAARMYLPNVRLTVDRFHVMTNLSKAVSKARCRMQQTTDPATRALLKGARWLLLKNPEHLTPNERATLEALLAASPELQTCYRLKEEFRAWFNTRQDRATAARGLETWLAAVDASGLKTFRTFTRLLRHWRESILNYFCGRHSNGFAEGVNLKIKMLNRRAFGYRNFQHFRLHILVAFDPRSR